MERYDAIEIREVVSEVQAAIMVDLRHQLKYTAGIANLSEIVEEYRQVFIHRLMNVIYSDADCSENMSLARIELTLRRKGMTAIRRTTTPSGLYLTYKGWEFAFTISSYGRTFKVNDYDDYTSYFWHESIIDLIDIICEECEASKVYPIVEQLVQESMKEKVQRDILLTTADSILRDRFQDENYSVAAASVDGVNIVYYLRTPWGFIDIYSPVEELAERLDSLLIEKRKLHELL